MTSNSKLDRMCCESIDVRRRCWKFSIEDEKTQPNIGLEQYLDSFGYEFCIT